MKLVVISTTQLVQEFFKGLNVLRDGATSEHLESMQKVGLHVHSLPTARLCFPSLGDCMEELGVDLQVPVNKRWDPAKLQFVHFSSPPPVHSNDF